MQISAIQFTQPATPLKQEPQTQEPEATAEAPEEDGARSSSQAQTESTDQTARPTNEPETVPLVAAQKRSVATSQSVVEALNASGLSQSPNNSFDEDAARAAAQAYRESAVQAAILERTSIVPVVASIEAQRTQSDETNFETVAEPAVLNRIV